MEVTITGKNTFIDVTAKLGNMRKAVEWVIYPFNAEDRLLMIQCDKRIAQINLETGKGMLSDGKGGHQGFFKLNRMAGAKEIDCPSELLEQLREIKRQKYPKAAN